MSQAFEHEYTEDEFLEVIDSLDGATLTLEQTVDDYINTLGEYLTDNNKEYDLRQSIYPVVDSMERLYESMDSLDDMISEENMTARVKLNGKRGVCDLERSLSEISNGTYEELESFEGLLNLMNYLDQNQNLEPDIRHDRKNSGKKIDAPTRMIYEKDKLFEIKEKINLQYNRLTFSEIIARRETESNGIYSIYEPEPPIFSLIGRSEHYDKLNKLNEQVKKES